jgi:hypothetical protein
MVMNLEGAHFKNTQVVGYWGLDDRPAFKMAIVDL